MSLPVLLIDNDFVNTVYLNNGAFDEAFGNAMLDNLSKCYDIQITDRVYIESTGNQLYPKDAAFYDWISKNDIVPIRTPTGASGVTGSDSGDASMLEVKNGLATEYVDGTPLDIDATSAKIATGDKSFWGEGKTGGAFQSDVLTPQQFLNKGLADGTIDIGSYMKVRDNNPTLLGLHSDDAAFNETPFAKQSKYYSENGIVTTPDGYKAPLGNILRDGIEIDTGLMSLINNLSARGRSVIKVGGLIGTALILADIYGSCSKASEQRRNGDYEGAETTIVSLIARTGLGIAASVGGMMAAGAVLGWLGIAVVGGGPLVGAALLLGGLLGGVVGGTLGDMAGPGIHRLLDEFGGKLGGLGKDIGDWIRHIGDNFNRSLTDPIVFDLSGRDGGIATGVQLTALANSNAYFDLHNTGFAVHTGWVGADTGLLVQDDNSNGGVDDITELFGSSTTDGFSALEALDANGDRVIDSSDAGFSNLKVWLDANGDGVTDAGELQSLSNIGIMSISLNDTPSDQTVNGNVIGSVATFTYSDGAVGQVAEAFFNNSQLESTYNGSYILDPEVLLLPNLRGYGTLPDLSIAMSLDPTLLNMVRDLTLATIGDAGEFSSRVTAILYQWAGVTNVDSSGRGAYVDGQHLAVLEAFVGQDFVAGTTSAPSSIRGNILESAWNRLLIEIQVRLLSQGPLTSLLTDVSFNYASDSLTGTADFSALVEAIGNNCPSDAAVSMKYWATMVPFANHLASKLGVSESTFDAQIRSAFSVANLPFSFDVALSDGVFCGAEGDDFYKASSTAGSFVLGGGGNDSLTGNTGEDVLDGGAGNDTLIGKGGADTYIFGRGYGQDTIDDNDPYSGYSVVKFNSDTSPADVIVSRDANDNLILKIAGTTDQLTITNEFWISQCRVDSVQFSDGTTWDYATLLGKVMVGTPGDDIIRGDKGDNVLDGGAGNDTLIGNGGADTYVFGRGYGQDTVNDYDAYSRYSVVKFNGDTAPSDVIVSRDSNNNLILKIAGTTDQLTITNEFVSSMYRVDAVQFSDGTTWDYATLLSKVGAGTPGDDILRGDSGANILDGREGNDTLIGNGGADTYIFGRGYGQDTVNDYDAYSRYSVVKFNLDTAPSDVIVSRDTGDNLILKIAGTTDQLTITNEFWMTQYRVDAVQFSDGTTWDYATLLSKVMAGTPGNDLIRGDKGDNILDGGAGNDALIGNGGADTYIFGRGYGQDIVNDYDAYSRYSVVKFNADTVPSDVIISRESNNNLILKIAGTTDQLTITNEFLSSIYRVDAVQFSDGTTWTYADLTGFKLGSSGNDALIGTTADNIFYASAGTDTLTGGGGYDTYKISSNIGTTTINNAVSDGTVASGEIDFMPGFTSKSACHAEWQRS